MPTKSRSKRPAITGYDLMDTAEVAEAFGVKPSSLLVAMSQPGVFPALAGKVPEPLRKVGNSWVWLRADIEGAL